MMNNPLSIFQTRIDELKEQSLYKNERIITTMQSSLINTTEKEQVFNLCANNYLGLCDNPAIIQAAKEGLDRWGFGLSSVRFICGTQQIHKDLENALSTFLGMEDTILYSSCFDANGGLFETLLSQEDAVISDALNHASIIDGIRLSKAARYRYQNNNMIDLEEKLKEASGARIRLIATDGIFSMDGYVANLKAICDLADKYHALVMVDDSHAVGFMGETGRGTHEYCGVMDRIDIITGTLGKAMGGASGGYTSGKKEIIDLLRQQSRPYLFSNTLTPALAAASLEVLHILSSDLSYRARLFDNTTYFRNKMEALGFDLLPGDHPIVPIMLYDAKIAMEFADRMLKKGVYVVGFVYPVVPKEKARIRTQMSSSYTKEQIDQVVESFKEVRDEMGLS
ncbi:MAG: glycine C-acetyltransferase [Clostridiales bacterium]|nr:glycine C-acetyltransferase [Clostridiales bacterium]